VLDRQPGVASGSLHEENARLAGVSRRGPRRILHVLSGLAYGGIEMWLLNVMRATDRGHHPMDFLVLTDQSGECEDEVRALGGRVIRCPHPRQPWLVARRFREALRTEGPYAVVHSHVHHYSGFMMRLAAHEGVPVRVVHSHNDTRAFEARRRWPRQLYLSLMKRWIRRYATDRIAVSGESAEDLYGASWAAEKNCEIIYCGLDFAPFAAIADRRELLAALGLPADALVIGHVGRFFWRKNHAYLLDVAAEVFAREPRARLLCLGDGPLKHEIQGKARAMGIAERILFAGSRTDVPLLMKTVMDVFVLPSHHEGLSLATLEAQAAGLPCVLADGLTREGDVLPQLIHRLPLDAPAAKWAECLLQIAGRAPMRREGALDAMSESEFSIQRSVTRLLQVYGMSP
jgi:glycosyltransferase involved in cell wall biosynthesis